MKKLFFLLSLGILANAFMPALAACENAGGLHGDQMLKAGKV